MAVSIFQGLNFEVCGTSPELCLIRRDFKSDVLPIYRWSGCKRPRKIQVQYITFSPSTSRKPSVALRAMEGILRTLRFTPLIFALQKKSTDSKPDGLPSVALAKDGGAKETRTLDPHTASVML